VFETQNWNVALKLFGIVVMIPIKIIIETPFPTPLTVI
jgi:hypothetical protein